MGAAGPKNIRGGCASLQKMWWRDEDHCVYYQAPPLVPTFCAPAQDNWSADYMAPLEEYLQDPEYTN